jgi:hypothetical protein
MSDDFNVKFGHEFAKVVYEQVREMLEREGKIIGLPHYEELSKKYDGDKQIKQYFDELLQSDQSVKDNEKDNRLRDNRR